MSWNNDRGSEVPIGESDEHWEAKRQREKSAGVKEKQWIVCGPSGAFDFLFFYLFSVWRQISSLGWREAYFLMFWFFKSLADAPLSEIISFFVWVNFFFFFPQKFCLI